MIIFGILNSDLTGQDWVSKQKRAETARLNKMVADSK